MLRNEGTQHRCSYDSLALLDLVGHLVRGYQHRARVVNRQVHVREPAPHLIVNVDLHHGDTVLASQDSHHVSSPLVASFRALAEW